MNRNIIVEKKFDQIADDYSFFNYTLNLRAQKIIKILHDANLNKSNTKILDIGVAGGELAKLYKGNQLLTGLDISTKMIDKAKKKIPDAIFERSDGEKLVFPDSSFNVVIISEVLYYMNNPLNCLQESRRVLNPGGKLIVFSRNQFWQKFEWFRRKIGIGPTDNLFDRMFYNRELYNMADKVRFNNINTETFCFMPFKSLAFFDRTPLKNLGHIIMLSATK